MILMKFFGKENFALVVFRCVMPMDKGPYC